MLSREAILSGTYLQAFKQIPENQVWSLEKIDASLNATMALRPEGPIWVFGYGSLIWNPLFEYMSREIATLAGWHRSFCLRTTAGRGSAEIPGRMLSLERGGSTEGVALQLPEQGFDEELRVIWIREMITGAYVPTWAEIQLFSGPKIKALVFAANTAHSHHETNSDIAHVAPIIATATGAIGSNAEYVRKLDSALAEHDLRDAYIESLVEELDRIQSALKLL